MQRYAEMVPLDEVAYFEMGQSPRSKYVNDRGDGVPFLQGNAEFGSVTPNHELHCTKPSKLCEPGDILISVRAPVGDLNKADQVYCIGRGLAAVRFEGLLPEFGWHALNYWAKDLHRFAQGTTFLAVSKSHLQQLEIIHLPKEEQRRIAEILDTADAAIQQTEAVIAKLKEVKAGLLHDLLTRGLDENGRLRDPVAHPEQFKETEIGRVPNEWDVEALGEYTISSAFGPRFSSTAYDDHGNVACLRTTDLDEEGNISLSTMPIAQLNAEKFRSHFLEVGDVLVTRSGTCGITTVFPGYEIPVLPGAFLIRFRLRTGELLPEFVRRYFNWRSGRRRLMRLAAGGVQKNLKGSSLLAFHIPIPSLEEQENILNVLHAHEARIRTEGAYRDKLQKAKRGLMQDLLTGRVRV